MKGYIAKKESFAQFLSKDSQMDTALKKGCTIYRVEDDGTEVAIATPEKGFLNGRPELEKIETMENPYAKAIQAMLMEEGVEDGEME